MRTFEFAFQKLEVYQLALRLQPLIRLIVADLPRGYGDLRSQATRSERSIRLNIAEGAGRNSPGGKAERYRTARGSANECAAALDEIRRDRLAPEVSVDEAARLIHRIISMLTRLIMTWETRS
jgi:four helix bundle protein